MKKDATTAISERKRRLRQIAREARRAMTDKAGASEAAIRRLLETSAYQRAEAVLWFVGSPFELQTQSGIDHSLAAGKRVAVPYCTTYQNGVASLGLWRLRELNELVIGKWGILEPPPDRWRERDRIVEPSEVELAIVPGVAFDRRGARLGNGFGYYDRLLAELRPDCAKVGLCFACQVLDEVDVEIHDAFVDGVVTELGVIGAI